MRIKSFFNKWPINLAPMLILLLLCAKENDEKFIWRTSCAVDFVQFWVVGNAIQTVNNIRDVYLWEDRSKVRNKLLSEARSIGSGNMRCAAENRFFLNLTGTPFLYTVFYLMSSGDYDTDYEFYRVLSLSFLIGGIVIICFQLSYHPLVALSFLPILFYFYPLKHEIMVSNVNELQVGGIALFLLFIKFSQKHYSMICAGIVLGLLIFFKPNLAVVPMLLIPSWFFLKKYNHVRNLVIGFAFASVLVWYMTTHYLGSACSWRGWYLSLKTEAAQRIVLQSRYIGVSSQSRVPFYHQIFAAALIFVPLFLVWIKSKGVRFTWRFFQSHKDPSFLADWDYNLVGLGICIYLLAGPLIHPHYFLLTIPFFLVLLRAPAKNHIPNKNYLIYFRYGVAIAGLFLISHHDPGIYNSEKNYFGVFLLYVVGIMDILFVNLREKLST